MRIDSTVIGMEKQAALDLITGSGLRARIETEDGEHFILTMDLDNNRLNLTVTDGKVTSVRRG